MRGTRLTSIVGLASALVAALVSGVAEYMLTGGSSTWVPLWAGLIGGVVGAAIGWAICLWAFNAGDEIGKERNAWELMDSIRGELTQVETDNLLKDHKGRRVLVSGGVEDVIELPGRLLSHYMVEVAMPGPIPRLATAFFGPRWASRVRALKVGDPVSLDGKVLAIDPHLISLAAARLRPVGDD